MEQLPELSKLSTHHCVLLAARYAAESNIDALRTLTTQRRDDLEFGLVLRLLLTFLPETLEPSRYTEYLNELLSGSPTPEPDALDTSSVSDLSDSQARKRARKLHVLLQPLAHSLYENEHDLDPFTHFLIHRSHRIDAETGLLIFVPQLVDPFLDHSLYLRTWFVSTVLPLLRLGYEYYPQEQAPSLETFAQWKGRLAIDNLLSNLRRKNVKSVDIRQPGRDLKAIVGPWMCGSADRARRGSHGGDRRMSVDQPEQGESDDWECLFEWLVQTSKNDFSLISTAFVEWDGPEDLDLGGYENGQAYLDEKQQRRLERRYAQSALASLYAVQDSSIQTIQASHAVLSRLCSLLNLDTLPDLTSSMDALPVFDGTSPISPDSTSSILQDENLLQPENAITQPTQGAVRLLEHFVFSAYLLTQLQHATSIRDVARMYLRNDPSEQSSLLQRLVHSLASGTKHDAEQWKSIRLALLWLWNWGTDKHEGERPAQGILGTIERETIEKEILGALIESAHYPLATQLYIENARTPLSSAVVEKVILKAAMHHYDNASNGNRTRGGMKRASDIIVLFKPYFPRSSRFRRVEALLIATHAMSFYSLTLQHGVPFQPVNIRVSTDPLSLLDKLLSQNPDAYNQLNDLISIGQNLVVSMPSTLMDDSTEEGDMAPTALEKKKLATERRVIGMAVEAALDNDDFETAYSYVVNRLSAPSESPAVTPALSTPSRRMSSGYFSVLPIRTEDEVDDISWRAALRAGRYRPSLSSSWSGSGPGFTTRPDLRWLDQRMELLSQALLLAPPGRLEEVLVEWQQCEKETEEILAEEAEAEDKFNDMADRRVPGAFRNDITLQPRREVGRGAVEEAPMGLFDVARGAAAAFSKTAFPLRAISAAARNDGRESGAQGRASMDQMSDSGSVGGEDRVRRRDMVANAVTGGLASGLGWVLGATPVNDRDRQ
ncbi:secretory pathway Sec39 [Sporormia fimetaria CBS 119925]|uniref:Secretory pathway Sec39 n=1 Tax=Sporormia fimetaria CBS 119925 TaxID=1340428 RepID=A0A6A6V480_9PLEO|nr:secretory pathway Sec39 [Sporormia fimetaria CBS 119925]